VSRVSHNSDGRSLVIPGRWIKHANEKRHVCGKMQGNHIVSSVEGGKSIDGKIVENDTGGSSQSSDMELDNDRRFPQNRGVIERRRFKYRFFLCKRSVRGEFLPP
jgi:hypothetical protein